LNSALNSFVNDFNNAQHIKVEMIVKGLATTMDIVLTASSPPANKKTVADPAVMTPHAILT